MTDLDHLRRRALTAFLEGPGSEDRYNRLVRACCKVDPQGRVVSVIRRDGDLPRKTLYSHDGLNKAIEGILEGRLAKNWCPTNPPSETDTSQWIRWTVRDSAKNNYRKDRRHLQVSLTAESEEKAVALKEETENCWIARAESVNEILLNVFGQRPEARMILDRYFTHLKLIICGSDKPCPPLKTEALAGMLENGLTEEFDRLFDEHIEKASEQIKRESILRRLLVDEMTVAEAGAHYEINVVKAVDRAFRNAVPEAERKGFAEWLKLVTRIA